MTVSLRYLTSNSGFLWLLVEDTVPLEVEGSGEAAAHKASAAENQREQMLVPDSLSPFCLLQGSNLCKHPTHSLSPPASAGRLQIPSQLHPEMCLQDGLILSTWQHQPLHSSTNCISVSVDSPASRSPWELCWCQLSVSEVCGRRSWLEALRAKPASGYLRGRFFPVCQH